MQQKFRLLGRSAVLPQVDSLCLGYGGGQKKIKHFFDARLGRFPPDRDRDLHLHHHGRRYSDLTVTVSGVDSNDTLLDSPDIDSLAGGIGNDVYYSETPATR